MTPPDAPSAVPSADSQPAAARVKICTRRQFDFGNLAASEGVNAVLARAVPCAGYASATLVVVVHELTITSGEEVHVTVRHASVTPDDPLVTFLAIGEAATVTLTDGAEPLYIQALDGSPGTHLQVAADCTRNSGSTVTITATLSIELLLRTVATPAQAGAGGTDLTGLGTDNHVPRWDGTDTLQDSGVSLDDSNNLSGINRITTASTITAGAVAYSATDGTNGQVLTTNGAGVTSFQTPTGLSISGTDNRLVRMNGTSAIQSSGVTLSDGDDMSGVNDFDADGDITTTGGNVVVATASGRVDIGTTTGSSTLRMFKSDSLSCLFDMRSGSTQTLRFRITLTGAENTTIGAFSTGGTTLGGVTLSGSTGNWQWDSCQLAPATTTQSPTGSSVTIDFNNGNFHRVVLNSASDPITFTLSNPLHGATYRILLVLNTNSVNRTTSWPSNVFWCGGTVSSPSAPFDLDTNGDASNVRQLITLTYSQTDGQYFGEHCTIVTAE